MQSTQKVFTVSCKHTGYHRLKGKPTHHRTWVYSKNSLSITDNVEGNFIDAYAYYHLHPNIQILDCVEQKIVLITKQGKMVKISVEAKSFNWIKSKYSPEFGIKIPSNCLRVKLGNLGLVFLLTGVSMAKKKIMLVFGTRPEAIKMAPLVHELKKEKNNLQVQVCVTAQHRQMLDQTLRIFNIKPDIDLDIMKPKQDLFDITSAVLKNLRDQFSTHKPDIILAHGDTTTTMSTALASFYAKIPLGHIEAGLRTYNLASPFPEEFNRQLVTKIAKWHFAPTELAKQNLLDEGIDNSLITVTGNTVIDSLYWVLKRIKRDGDKKLELDKSLDEILNFNWKSERFVLITGHRRENFGAGFQNICRAIRDLAIEFSEIKFVYPVHLNPNVIEPVNRIISDLSNVFLVEPLDYEPFIYLLSHWFFVLTDSGGIQEEAKFGKLVLLCVM